MSLWPFRRKRKITRLILVRLGTESYPADLSEMEAFEKKLRNAQPDANGDAVITWHHAIDVKVIDLQ